MAPKLKQHLRGIAEPVLGREPLLVRLRDSLGISASDVDAIEGELQAGSPSLA